MNATYSETGSLENALLAESRSAEIPEMEDMYGWLIGSWELDVIGYDDDGNVIHSAGEAHVGRVLEGRAVQDVFIIRVAPSGRRTLQSSPIGSARRSASTIHPSLVGRQLFVDDFLISDTTLKRTFHLPKYHPASPVDRLAEIQARKDVVRGGARLFNQWLPNASEADLISYFDRVKMYGEPAAISWLASRQN